MSPDDPRHGEERGYYAHRKAGEKPCHDCTVAHRAEQKRRTLRIMNGTGNWIPALGTQRRIQALVAIGWRLEDIAESAGYARAHEVVSPILHRRTRVRARTAERFAAAYERLSGTPGPSSRVRVNARKRGWAPPLAWDDIDDPNEKPRGFRAAKTPRCDVDPVTVDLIVGGQYDLYATPAERIEVVRRWRADGRSLAELERRTGWNANRYRPRKEVA